MRQWLALLAVIAAGAALGLMRIAVPVPLPPDAPPGQFSAGRAMADVRAMARAPHPTGSAQAAAVIAHLERRLAALGFATQRVTTPLPAAAARRLARWGGDPGAPAISLIAVRAGTHPAADASAPAVAIMAHHDTVWGSPGAADDAAGVAAALEVARAIPPAAQRRDLMLIFTDGEELGLVGARAIFAPGAGADPIAAHIGVLINLEARGMGGRAMMFQTGPANGALIALLARAAPGVAASSAAVSVYENLPNDTDFTPALARRIMGLNFAFIGDAWGYHSPLATPANLDQGALQDMGDAVHAVAAALLAGDALPPPAPAAQFASLPGAGLIVIGTGTGWLLAAATLALLLLGGWHTRPSVARLAMALGQALLLLVLAGVATAGLDLLSGWVGHEYYDRLAALPRLQAAALLAVAAVLLFAASAPAGSADERALAWIALAWAAGVAALILLPGAAPIIAWPALLAALGWAPGPFLPRAGVWLAALLAIPGIALLAEIGHFAFLGVGLGLVLVPLLLPALALLAVVLPAGPRRPALAAAAAALVCGAGVALWVNLDAPASSVPVYA